MGLPALRPSMISLQAAIAHAPACLRQPHSLLCQFDLVLTSWCAWAADTDEDSDSEAEAEPASKRHRRPVQPKAAGGLVPCTQHRAALRCSIRLHWQELAVPAGLLLAQIMFRLLHLYGSA